MPLSDWEKRFFPQPRLIREGHISYYATGMRVEYPLHLCFRIPAPSEETQDSQLAEASAYDPATEIPIFAKDLK